jgi:hypothetical protein
MDKEFIPMQMEVEKREYIKKANWLTIKKFEENN